MIEIHPQVLKKNGKNQFVILPFREFEAIREALEEAGDALALREARAQDDPSAPGYTLEEVRLRLGLGDHRKQGKRRGRSIGRTAK